MLLLSLAVGCDDQPRRSPGLDAGVADAPGLDASPTGRDAGGELPDASVPAPDTTPYRGELKVAHLGPVAPDVIGVRLLAGRIIHGKQVSYAKQAGDTVKLNGHQRYVYRSGAYLGSLVGAEGKTIYTPEKYEGDRLPEAAVDDIETYRISSDDDPAYASPVHPKAVGRKTKPSDIGWLDPGKWDAPTETVVYLRLAEPLEVGKSYRVAFDLSGLAAVTFTHAPAALRSEAVHVSHVGFRPGDPSKLAFLSCWMGTAGPLGYKEGLGFDVVERATGKVAFSGKTTLAKAKDKAEDASGRNYNLTDVYELDFSALEQPGEYVVVVEGIGCSYPFRIHDQAWRGAFVTSARGLYHQRSGIELGPPFTTFKRPRPFHPKDGVKVFASTCPLMESGNGLNYSGNDPNNFTCLVKGKTSTLVPDAWGGYMDAGDWDRRVQHLRVTRYLIELAELNPSFFAKLSLNIPESGGALPDVVSEALFNLDFYRRLQDADGGVRGGVESAEHPRRGEGSWQESQEIMAYAPGIWSSHAYAGAAARAAHYLKPLAPALSKTYRETAIKAMTYAEAKLPALGSPKLAPEGVVDMRNLAAAELFRLTGDAKWHDIFIKTTVFKAAGAPLTKWPDHNQRDNAWVYLQTSNAAVDKQVQAGCRQAILAEADARVKQIANTGFRWTKDTWAPAAWGVFGIPDGISIARAHRITGDSKYLEALVRLTQHSAGANPINMSYTTGIGPRYPRHPLHVDSLVTNQPPPAGLTVFGPVGVKEGSGFWGQTLANPFLHPKFDSWPTTEAYWDIFHYGAMCEFVVDGPMIATAYVWGYLAATPRP
jgi:endoglucanase